MPFFSFILKKNFPSSELGFHNENDLLLYKNKRYFSKNTKVWNILREKIFSQHVKAVTYEKHIKAKKNINSIIFCLPHNIGVGDAVEYGLAIKAISKSKLFKKIAIAFSSTLSNIFIKYLNLDNVYPDFISEDQIIKYDTLFHFSSELESLKLQKHDRQNIEALIISFFKVNYYRKEIKTFKNKIKRVSIFPISKSPIRTFSTELINKIIQYLEVRNYSIDLVLDKNSLISNRVEKNIISKNAKFIYPKYIDDLILYIKKIEFGIFCDSGPLHLSKLYRKIGIVISTSVDAKNLFNEVDKIKYYNSDYKSLFCRAPCGLTNIINFDNRHGCYDSLQILKNKVLKSDQTHLLHRGNLQKSFDFFIDNPVGCIKFIRFNNIKLLLDETLK